MISLKKNYEILHKDRRLSVEMMLEITNINIETITTILTKELQMVKVWPKMVPKTWPRAKNEQKKHLF